MAEPAQNIIPFPAQAQPAGGPCGEEGQVARAHRRALLARFGRPYQDASDSTLIEALFHGVAEERDAVAAELARRGRQP